MKMNSDEQKKLIHNTESMISGNNVWERIEYFFTTNEIANKYLKEAEECAARDNCQSYASIMIVALENMCERIKEANAEEDNVDLETLHQKIFKLECENVKLMGTIKDIAALMARK